MHVRDPAPPPSRFDLSIPPEADEILLRVLQKGPLDRFPDAGSFRNQLEGARKAWAVWTKRAATGERAVGPVSLSSSAEVRTAPTEARRPAARAPVATRALEASSPDPIPLATRGISAPIDPGKSQHERVMLAGIGSLLALGVGGALFLSGALSSGAEDPGAEDALMAPINLRIEAGATAATVRWESKVEYPSVVRVREDGSRRDGVRVQRTDEDGQPAAPTRQHQVDVDGLEPGVEYQVVVVFPGSRRSLPRKFETPKIRFLDYPHAELSGGKLRVRWRTNLPARGLVKARVVVQGRKSAEERRHDTRVYSRDGEATLPGFRREDTIQFRVLLYSEWWDQQIARDVGRVGPEVHTDWFELASRILKDRAAKDQVAAVLRDLPERPAEPWPLPGDDGYQALVERLAASFKDAQFARLRSEFQPGLEGFFSSEEVDWVERRNWYQDVARFDDWLYGLEARLVRVPFQARSLYPPGWRPLGETSVLRRGGAFVEQAEVRFVDGEDPDFDSTVGSGRKPVAVTFEAPGARGWARAEFGVKVEGLPPGSAVTADFGRGLRFRLRPQEDGAAARPLGSSGGAWLFHEVPPALLGPGTVFGAVGLYTAPGVPVGGRAKILAAEVRGQRASR